MPGYIKKALLRFKQGKPKKMQNSPHPHTIPDYGNKIEYTADKDDTPKLGKDDTKYIQQVAGTLFYYARAEQLLDYISTQQEAIIAYRASDMILSVHSNAGYCNEKIAQSQAGGHFYSSNNNPTPLNNRAIHTIATIIKNVMSLVAEAELGALNLNAKETVYLRQILREMGHLQPPTPIQTDNTTAKGVVNIFVQPKCTKAMDMCFHWLQDQEKRNQFCIFWRLGGANLADYWMKHHPPAHHVKMRTKFLTNIEDLATKQQASKHKIHTTTKLQGCVKLPKNRQYNTSLGEGKNGGRI